MASEFVHRYGQFFAGGVFWMSFADAANVPTEVADCGRSLGLLHGFDAATIEQQVWLVEEAWSSPISRLLVFDNCEEEALVQRWRPRFGNARVLITSRRPEWDLALAVKTVPLTTLPRPASTTLLRLFRPDIPENEPAFDAIAAELGDLPLALHLAGSFLRTYRGASIGQPATYLESLQQKNLLEHPSLHGRGSGISPTRHESDVGRTFDLSFERLDSSNPTDALALDLLARAAWFAAGESIPRPLLSKTVQLDTEDVSVSLLTEESLHRLTALGLLETNDKNDLIMHRLVAAWAQRTADGDTPRMGVEQTILREAQRLNQNRNPALLLHWQPHLRAITNSAIERADMPAAQLCDEMGFHLWLAGDYSGALFYLERAIGIHETISGLEHGSIAHSLNLIGNVFISLRQFDQARSHINRALEIRQRLFGLEHPLVAESLNDLGNIHGFEEDYESAVTCHFNALMIREKSLGEEHSDTARSLGNLGIVLGRRGDLEGAQMYGERALAIRQKVFGMEHPETAHSLTSLGYLFERRGDLKQAKLNYESALKIQEKATGQEHPEAARILNMIGNLLAKEGDLEQARVALRRALTIQEKVLGPHHPDTAESLNALGVLLANQGLLREALPYNERALLIQERALGPTHPGVARILSIIGDIYFKQKSYAKARAHWDRALFTLVARFGNSDPEARGVRRRLGLLPGARRQKVQRKKVKRD